MQFCEKYRKAQGLGEQDMAEVNVSRSEAKESTEKQATTGKVDTESVGSLDNRITEGVIWKQLLLFFFPILFGSFFRGKNVLRTPYFTKCNFPSTL